MLRNVSKAEAGLLKLIRKREVGRLMLRKYGDGGWTLALSDEPNGKATHAGSGATFDECWRRLQPIVRP
jgi:hypothetical protein